MLLYQNTSKTKWQHRIHIQKRSLAKVQFWRDKSTIGVISLHFFHSFFKIIFYWRIIALQNFAVFCQTSTWMRHRYIPSHISPPFWTSLPSPSPLHPPSLIQSPCLSFLSHVSFHVTLSIHLTLSSPLPMSISLFLLSILLLSLLPLPNASQFILFILDCYKNFLS